MLEVRDSVETRAIMALGWKHSKLNEAQWFGKIQYQLLLNSYVYIQSILRRLLSKEEVMTSRASNIYLKLIDG